MWRTRTDAERAANGVTRHKKTCARPFLQRGISLALSTLTCVLVVFEGYREFQKNKSNVVLVIKGRCSKSLKFLERPVSLNVVSVKRERRG